MFTGIIEATGVIKKVESVQNNKSFWIGSALAAELKPDQSLAHDGVCLTVEEILGGEYKVTAVAETLEKTTLDAWKTGRLVNLERALVAGSRLDGHFVQGHVDATGLCEKIKDKKGSIEIEFSFPKKFSHLVIEKGSICLNGISLTVFKVKKNRFTVAIIPYTFDHTNMKNLQEGNEINLEFDLIGKYINKKNRCN
jgi:riboflavin synthase